MVCVFVFVDWRFEDLKFQIRENLLFLPINIAYDALIQICTLVFRRRLVKFADLRTCHEKLRICDLRTQECKVTTY
jgi:hypothetical protein